MVAGTYSCDEQFEAIAMTGLGRYLSVSDALEVML